MKAKNDPPSVASIDQKVCQDVKSKKTTTQFSLFRDSLKAHLEKVYFMKWSSLPWPHFFICSQHFTSFHCGSLY